MFKTRSLATKACQAKKVFVNGERVKPSQSIKLHDQLKVRCSSIYKTFTVLDLPIRRQNAQSNKLFILDTTPDKEYTDLKEKRKVRVIHRSNFKGRPTKKDRRKIDIIIKQMP